MAPKNQAEALEQRNVLRRAETSGKREIIGALEAVWEKLVRWGVVYALVCEKKNDRVDKRSEMAEWRR